jgi:pimeloyl-ACP methyl ester carboxylesterase
LIGTGAKLGVNPTLLDQIQSDFPSAAAAIIKWAWAKDAPETLRQRALEELLKVDPAVLYGDYLACSHFDLSASLPKITAPTLVIGGTVDKMTPLPLSQFLVEQIRGATLEMIPNGGHYMMLEQPQAVAQAVNIWLKNLPPAP